MAKFLADRRVRWIGGGVLALFFVLLALAAIFPFGWLRPQLEARLSKQLGLPVTIAALERRQAISFTPTLDIGELRIAQPGWAGAGELAIIDTASVTLPVLPLLIGRVDPSTIEIGRGRLVIVRDGAGRTNLPARGSGDGGGSQLADLRIRNLAVDYRDAKQDRRLSVRLASDERGLRIAGTGAIAGNPVRVTASGPRVAGHGDRPWPFVVRIAGPALDLAATARMDRPLSLRHLDLSVKVRADDLKLVDRVIEAGLFGTQPVNLAAEARRDGDDWNIRRIAGTIGRSDIAGALTVKKRDGRVRLDGQVRSNRLDFDDFASDAGMAAAKALEQAQGLKLVPNARVNIAKMAETDGRIAVDIRRIFSARRPSSLANAKGVLTIERGLMTAEPLRVGLTRGAITGRVTVDQRGRPGAPKVTLDLRLTGASIATLMGGGDAPVDAPLSGRALLTGVGDTIRAAVGRSDGRIGLVARDGVLPARIASALGFDAGRALTTDEDSRARLRCAIVALDVRGGTGQFAPLLVDTDRSGTTGTGTLRFPQETLAITLTGAPKKDSVLRLPGTVRVGGTLRAPDIVIPPGTKSAGNILKAIGRAIGGNQGALAQDANCAALSARALR